MTIWKMFTVGIKNCIRNWKISLLFGVLLGLGLSLIASVPSALLERTIQNSHAFSLIILLPFVCIISLAVSVLHPVLTTLPLITAYTKPPQNGPQTFKGRFSKKFGPFLLLSLMWLGINMAISIVWIILLFLCVLVIGFNMSTQLFSLVLAPLLLIPLCFALIVLSSASYYSYIALTTENIKATQALAKGFQMLSKHMGRSIGNSLAFSLMAGIIPAILVSVAYYLTNDMWILSYVNFGYLIGLLLLWLVSLLLAYASQTVYTAAMVELYRKNWLEDHNNPFCAPVQAAPNFNCPPQGGYAPFQSFSGTVSPDSQDTPDSPSDAQTSATEERSSSVENEGSDDDSENL